jgi:hypothetical protein
MCEQDPPDHNTPQLIGRRGRLFQVNLVRVMHKVKSHFFFLGTSGTLVDPSIIEGRHESQTGKRQLSFSPPLSPAAAAGGSRCEM